MAICMTNYKYVFRKTERSFRRVLQQDRCPNCYQSVIYSVSNYCDTREQFLIFSLQKHQSAPIHAVIII